MAIPEGKEKMVAAPHRHCPAFGRDAPCPRRRRARPSHLHAILDHGERKEPRDRISDFDSPCCGLPAHRRPPFPICGRHSWTDRASCKPHCGQDHAPLAEAFGDPRPYLIQAAFAGDLFCFSLAHRDAVATLLEKKGLRLERNSDSTYYTTRDHVYSPEDCENIW